MIIAPLRPTSSSLSNGVSDRLMATVIQNAPWPFNKCRVMCVKPPRRLSRECAASLKEMRSVKDSILDYVVLERHFEDRVKLKEIQICRVEMQFVVTGDCPVGHSGHF